MILIDQKSDRSFGKYYGHPDGFDSSKEMVARLLNEFDLKFQDVANIIHDVKIPTNLTHITKLQKPFQTAFINCKWKNQPSYPESNYKADFGLNDNDRWIFVEIELSDIRRAVNAFFMDRVFRTAYMRLGIFITPQTIIENKHFYSQLTKRYDYIAPDYPLWVIGFEVEKR